MFALWIVILLYITSSHCHQFIGSYHGFPGAVKSAWEPSPGSSSSWSASSTGTIPGTSVTINKGVSGANPGYSGPYPPSWDLSPNKPSLGQTPWGAATFNPPLGPASYPLTNTPSPRNVPPPRTGQSKDSDSYPGSKTPPPRLSPKDSYSFPPPNISPPLIGPPSRFNQSKDSNPYRTSKTPPSRNSPPPRQGPKATAPFNPPTGLTPYPPSPTSHAVFNRFGGNQGDGRTQRRKTVSTNKCRVGNRLYKLGDKWTPEGGCSRHFCVDGGKTSVLGCPNLEGSPGCTLSDEDPRQPWPSCCPQLQCSR